ncbi:MAG: N-acetyl-alpha-D-glucosaminyl L-malate synthase BshA [bacterium]
MDAPKGRIGITCYPTFGGSGILATELGLELARRGWEVHFISSRTPRRIADYRERVFVHEVEPMRYPLFEHTPFALALAVKQAEVARGFDLDLLHVHYAIPHATSAWLAQQMLDRRGLVRHLKILTTLHGTDITLVGQDPSYYDITRFSLEVSDGITAVSDYLTGETRRIFNLDAEIERIHNFVDTEEYVPDPPESPCREKMGFGDEKLMLHVSNFREVKRIPDLMEIFLRVSRRMDSRLLLVGEGPELARALRFGRTHGLEDRVHAMGRVESPACFLAMSDLLLLPSRSESFGLVALEALSTATPVVASRVGGLPEVVSHGEDGYLEEAGDVDAMAARALELLGDERLLRAFGARGRERAVNSFSRDRIVDQYEAYYQRILSG